MRRINRTVEGGGEREKGIKDDPQVSERAMCVVSNAEQF